MKFKSGNIIYLVGERKDNNIFLLKEGRLLKDVKLTNSKISEKEIINKGEFFGIRSGMLGIPREETVQSHSNALVYVFNPSEFDLILKKNVSLIMNILIAFSNDLRRIHKVIENKIGVNEHADNEKKMLDIASYYQRGKKYQHAIYTYKRILEIYPSTVHKKKVKYELEKLVNK